MTMVEYAKNLITSRGKRFYIFFVGKLNVPKLANFQDIDMFVLIGCGQNSLIDSKEFFKPIITPYELELALKKYHHVQLVYLHSTGAKNGILRNI